MQIVPVGDLLTRSPDNPIVTLRDLPFRCSDIWNAGVTKVGGRYLLLITIETLEGRHCIYRALSDDGRHFLVDDEPLLAGDTEEAGCGCDPGCMNVGGCESIGVRDPRITQIDGTYYIAYVANGDHGLRVGLARTQDFHTIERIAYATQVDVKNGALFPRTIGGKYLLLCRPDQGGRIWLGYSDDLVFWGSQTVVMAPRGGYWDSTRIGAASPPIEIDEGWLLIYYGEKHTSAGPLVRLGAAVLDRDDPSRVIARSNIPILSPREKYERIGDVPNVVFSCGALLEEGQVNVYYGASDSCICLSSAPLAEILRVCFESDKVF